MSEANYRAKNRRIFKLGDREAIAVCWEGGAAERITAKLNSHDALIEACKTLLNSTDYCDDVRPLMNSLRAALALAEEGAE